jgi:hypothetical protein
VLNSDQQVLLILESLEQCKMALRTCGHDDAAHLVSVAILELRMKLNGVSDTELRALCDGLLPEDDLSAERVGDAKSAAGPRRRPLLRLVK